MIRRRLIIEWDDDGTDTDAECAKSFELGDWGIDDLHCMADEVKLKVWVEDAPAIGQIPSAPFV